MTDPVKYQKYLNVAAKLDDAETHLTLAKIAQDENRITEYIQHLNIAAKGRHTTGSKASRALGKIYFEGELMPRDLDKAMMHFFLSGKTRYVKGDKLTFPGQYPKMKELMREASTREHIEAGKQAADAFAKTYKFPHYRKQKIERSYGIAIYSFQHVQRTGGHWYKDRGWWLLMMLALIAIGSNSFAASKKKKNTNTSYTDI